MEDGLPKEPSAWLETLEDGFRVSMSPVASWGCSMAEHVVSPAGRGCSRPLRTLQAISIHLAFIPVGFWQNEPQYEPGKSCWYMALGSGGLPLSAAGEPSQAGPAEKDNF